MRPSRFLSFRVSCLALLATLGHALMPLLMVLPMQQGVSMVMCSTTSPRAVLVRYDVANPDTPTAPGQDRAVRCPLCVAGAHFGLAAQAPLRLPLLTGLTYHVRAAIPAARVVAAPWPDYLSRAPPSVT